MSAGRRTRARAILERIGRHSPILELLVTASGGRVAGQVSSLIRAGLIRRVDHPTVVERGTGRDYPADALEITDAGRKAIAG